MSGLLNPKFLESLSHADLLMMRQNATPEMQKLLAPYEHRAYAREVVADSPGKALSLGLLIPGYQMAKLVGAHSARTPASWEQLIQGYRGIGEGLGLSGYGK